MTRPFTDFSKSEVARAREELVSRFTAQAKELGLEIDLGRITYNDDELRCKLTVTLTGKEAVSEEKFPFLSAPNYPTIGQDFTFRRKAYTVTKIARNSPKYPIIAMSISTGKEYKFPLSAISE